MIHFQRQKLVKHSALHVHVSNDDTDHFQFGMHVSNLSLFDDQPASYFHAFQRSSHLHFCVISQPQ